MKSLIHRSTTLLRPLWAIAALAAFLIVIVFVVVSRVSAQSTVQTQGGHLVTIHDRGDQIVVSTAGDTIGDALKQAGIHVDPIDAVEPAATEKLVASEYNVNIYRARPVIVVDGATRQRVVTPYQSAQQIAKSVGVTLYPEDGVDLQLTNDIVAEGAGLKLIITRATAFSWTLYGTTTTGRTQAKTVGDMLKEKGVKLTVNDKVSPAASTPISEGLAVRVWREGKQTITSDVEIPFATEQIQDGDQYIGYKSTKTPGVPGMRSVTFEIIIQDGKEVGRTEIASVTTKNPSNQVDIVGAKYRGSYTTPTENESISWNFFLAQGFTRNQTAGIMGNLMQEHHFLTTGDGLAQWTGSRKAALLSRADPYNIYTQLQFLMDELNGGYAGVRDAIKAASSVNEAVVIFQNRFERCGVCMESLRVQYAYNILASH